MYSACVYCGSEEELQVEHVIPLENGGRHEITNMVIACKSCNSGKCYSSLHAWFKSNPKKKEYFYNIVREDKVVDKETGKEKIMYLPKSSSGVFV